MENRFHQKCEGEKSCQFNLTMSELFDSACVAELQRRWAGDTSQGPARLYFQTLCTQDTIYITPTSTIERSTASILIVCLDLLMMVLFTWAVIRLQYYEKLTIDDHRQGKMRIEDFTVNVRDIPIKQEGYKNNPQLLKAMIVKHLEDVVANEEPVDMEHQDDT